MAIKWSSRWSRHDDWVPAFAGAWHSHSEMTLTAPAPVAVLQDEKWMQRALALAEHAASLNEVPVGAVVVRDEQEIGAGWNCPVSTADPTAHAEVRALRAAAQAAGNYRLPGTTLYVTLEPCAMCAGAIIQARVARVVYAADDPKAGAAGSVFDVLGSNRLNHRPHCDAGLCADEAGAMLRAFFKARRGTTEGVPDR